MCFVQGSIASRFIRLSLAAFRIGGLALVLMAFGATEALAQPFAYVTNSGDGTVTVIDTATHTVVATVPVGSFALGVGVTPDGASVYVAHHDGVSVLDATTNTVTATIPLADDGSNGVAVSPDGTRVYVTQYAARLVSVIDSSTNAVVATVSIPANPYGIVVSPDGRFAYVTEVNGTLFIIDTATNTLVGHVAIGQYPGSVTVSPDGAFVYATAIFGGVWIVDTATRSVVTNLAEIRASGVAVTPDGKFLYLAVSAPGESDVVVVDAASLAVVTHIVAGEDPKSVAVTPDGRFVYAANIHGASVSVIETATNTVTATVPVGGLPQPLGQFIGPIVNRPPAPVGDSYATSIDTALTVAAPGVLSNDSDLDGDSLEASVVSGPAHGTLALSATGAFTYRPATGFTGSDAFTYRASDGRAAATAIATIAVSYPTCGIGVTPATLAQAYVAIPYLQALGTTSSGKYTFSVTAGALPPGLHLVSVFGQTGIIGIPQTSGTYFFTITAAKSGANCRASRSYTVIVPKTVVPLLTCVQKISGNTYRGTFGFASSMDAPVTIQVGGDNAFTPGAQNRGQVTTFAPGTVVNAFSVTFTATRQDNDLAIWLLRGPDGQRRPITVTRATFGCQ